MADRKNASRYPPSCACRPRMRDSSRNSFQSNGMIGSRTTEKCIYKEKSRQLAELLMKRLRHTFDSVHDGFVIRGQAHLKAEVLIVNFGVAINFQNKLGVRSEFPPRLCT